MIASHWAELLFSGSVNECPGGRERHHSMKRTPGRPWPQLSFGQLERRCPDEGAIEGFEYQPGRPYGTVGVGLGEPISYTRGLKYRAEVAPPTKMEASPGCSL
jgi:hypothetical protein